MRILFLGDINSAHLKRWVIGLKDREIEIGIYSFETPKSNWYLNKGVKILSPEKEEENPNSFYQHKKLVKQIIKEYQPDVVHAHGASNYGMLGRYADFNPFVISVLGNDVFQYPKKNFLSSTILRKNLYAADRIISSGIALKNETLKYTRKNVDIIPFGIDSKLFHPIQKPKSEIITIGMVKSMEDVYGVDLLIDAFSNLYFENNNLRLLLVGGGSKLKKYKNWVESIGLEKVVRFTGPREVEELPLYFSAIDICVFPARLESFGVAVLEASACGKPVIGSEVGGIPEVIQNEKTGLLIKKPGVIAIENAIKTLINDEELRRKMGEEGRKFVVENYAYRINIDKMINTYSKLLAE